MSYRVPGANRHLAEEGLEGGPREPSGVATSSDRRHVPAAAAALAPRRKGEAVSRAAYLYTLTLNGGGHDWRVYEALIQAELQPEVAQLVYVDEDGHLRTIVERHIRSRNSAHAWVRASELDLLAEDVEQDYEARRLWKLALDDVRGFVAARKRQDEEAVREARPRDPSRPHGRRALPLRKARRDRSAAGH